MVTFNIGVWFLVERFVRVLLLVIVIIGDLVSNVVWKRVKVFWVSFE